MIEQKRLTVTLYVQHIAYLVPICTFRAETHLTASMK